LVTANEVPEQRYHATRLLTCVVTSVSVSGIAGAVSGNRRDGRGATLVVGRGGGPEEVVHTPTQAPERSTAHIGQESVFGRPPRQVTDTPDRTVIEAPEQPERGVRDSAVGLHVSLLGEVASSGDRFQLGVVERPKHVRVVRDDEGGLLLYARATHPRMRVGSHGGTRRRGTKKTKVVNPLAFGF
jgi:hypothetical protein